MSRFRETLPREWIKYVLVVLIAAVLWTCIFGFYHAPKEYETLEVFFAGKVKDYGFEDVSAKALDGVKKVQLSTALPSDGNFKTKYDLVGLSSADVVIVPLTVAEQTDCSSSFATLEQISGEHYVQNEINYGVVLPQAAVDGLAKYFAFNASEQYIAFVNEASVNAGAITDNAYKFVKWLVDYNA